MVNENEILGEDELTDEERTHLEQQKIVADAMFQACKGKEVLVVIGALGTVLGSVLSEAAPSVMEAFLALDQFNRDIKALVVASKIHQMGEEQRGTQH